MSDVGKNYISEIRLSLGCVTEKTKKKVVELIDEKISTEKIACNMLINSGTIKNTFSKKVRLQKVESKDYLISILEELKSDIKLNSENAEKTCATKHVIPPKSKDSGILPNFTWN